jgi:hypothetical protein
MWQRIDTYLYVHLCPSIPGLGEHPYKGAGISEVLLGTEATRAARIFAIAGVECCTFESTVPILPLAEFVPNLDT